MPFMEASYLRVYIKDLLGILKTAAASFCTYLAGTIPVIFYFLQVVLAID